MIKLETIDFETLKKDIRDMDRNLDTFIIWNKINQKEMEKTMQPIYRMLIKRHYEKNKDIWPTT